MNVTISVTEAGIVHFGSDSDAKFNLDFTQNDDADSDEGELIIEFALTNDIAREEEGDETKDYYGNLAEVEAN